MTEKINIITAVDVIAALSDGTLKDNIYMMDNSPMESTDQGTPNLTTLCYAGQSIQWLIYAIDVQTPVMIKSITFTGTNNNPTVKNKTESTVTPEYKLDQNVWTGYVPYCMAAGLSYNYRLELQMGEGKRSLMYMDGPSLKRI